MSTKTHRKWLRRSWTLLSGLGCWLLCAWLAFGVWSWAPGGPATKVGAGLSIFLITWIYGFQRMERWRFWVGRSLLVIGLIALQCPQPSADRKWSTEYVGTLEAFESDGDITLRGVRKFRWKNTEDAEPAWGSCNFDINTVDQVWLVVEPFSAKSPLAHIMLSFRYHQRNGTPGYLAISIEAKREFGEIYHPVVGCFRRYELTYVVGDEADLIGLRAIHRESDVCLYPTTATPEQARTLLMTMIGRALKLQEEPEFYNSLTANCAGSVAAHLRSLWPNSVPWPEWRLIATSGLAEAAERAGLLRGKASDPHCHIRNLAQQLGDSRSDFSERIRVDFPKP